MEVCGQIHNPAALSSGHRPRYPMCRKLGGSQNRSGRYRVEKNLFPLPGIETRFLGRPACSLVAIPTELPSSSSSGATVHDEPRPLLRLFSLRPAAIAKRFSTVNAFYGVGPLTPRPIPNLEGQGIPSCVDHHLWPVRHGRPYQQLRYRRHSSQEHMTTQAAPLRQSSNTYGGTDLP
jgi:hypothetical protein